MEPVHERAKRIARPHGGLARRRDLEEFAGVSAASIRRQLRLGRWKEPYPGVIDLGTHERTWLSGLTSLVLAAGPAAWVSHGTAAHLHGFLDAPRPDRFDVLVPRTRHATVGGVRLHTTASIGLDEVTECKGLPCTGRARTLLDLSAALSPDQLERYLANLARRHPSVVTEVVRLTDRHRRARGRRRLLDVVARLPGDAARLGSPLEVVGVQRLRQLAAPPFALQYQVRDRDGAVIKRVDVAWPDLLTVLELDGADYHDLTGVRAADEQARARMRALGWTVEVLRRGDLEGARLREVVARLRDRWRVQGGALGDVSASS